MSKLPKLRINGVDLAEAYTRLDVQPHERTLTSIGRPVVAIREQDTGLVLTLHPLTVAQLYFDGVLPQDRAQPIKVKIGRGKTLEYRLVTQRAWKDRWQEHQLVLRFEKV